MVKLNTTFARLTPPSTPKVLMKGYEKKRTQKEKRDEEKNKTQNKDELNELYNYPFLCWASDKSTMKVVFSIEIRTMHLNYGRVIRFDAINYSYHLFGTENNRMTDTIGALAKQRQW